jgi:hypothetical protein
LTHQRASRSSITSRNLDHVSLLLLLLLFFLVFFSFFFSFIAFSLKRNSLNSAHISRGIVVERLRRRTNLVVMVDDPVLGQRSFHARSAIACVGLFA